MFCNLRAMCDSCCLYTGPVGPRELHLILVDAPRDVLLLGFPLENAVFTLTICDALPELI